MWDIEGTWNRSNKEERLKMLQVHFYWKYFSLLTQQIVLSLTNNWLNFYERTFAPMSKREEEKKKGWFCQGNSLILITSMRSQMSFLKFQLDRGQMCREAGCDRQRFLLPLVLMLLLSIFSSCCSHWVGQSNDLTVLLTVFSTLV